MKDKIKMKPINIKPIEFTDTHGQNWVELGLYAFQKKYNFMWGNYVIPITLENIIGYTNNGVFIRINTSNIELKDKKLVLAIHPNEAELKADYNLISYKTAKVLIKKFGILPSFIKRKKVTHGNFDTFYFQRAIIKTNMESNLQKYLRLTNPNLHNSNIYRLNLSRPTQPPFS